MAENTAEKFNENILDEHQYAAGKFYRVCYDGDAHLKFMNSDLCDMTGYSYEEIHEKFGDSYINLIYSDDRPIYEDFLKRVTSEECSLMVQYRIVTKNNDIIRVSDTTTSQRQEEGKLWSFSVVTVIADILSGSEKIKHVCEEVPCGIIRFTHERYPSVLAMNSGMESLIDAKCINDIAIEDMKENIFFMIPFEYRQAFHSALERVDRNENNVNIDMEIFKCDGSRVPVSVWLYSVKAGSATAYQGVFLESDIYITDAKKTLKKDFLNALTYVYDAVYEINIIEKTVSCLRTKYPDIQNNIPGVRMLADDIIEFWCKRIPVPARENNFREFFKEVINDDFDDTVPHTIAFSIDFNEFNVKSSKGTSDKIRDYSGTYFKLNEIHGVFCCSDMTLQKKKMAEAMAHSNIMEFKIKDNILQPLNVTGETYRFLGMSVSEMDRAVNEGMSIDEFFAHCPLSADAVRSIINDQLDVMKEYTVTYADGRKVKRYASMIACGIDAEDTYVHYAVRYNTAIPGSINDVKDENNSEAPDTENRKIEIRTFGYFDVFVDGKAVSFKSSKAKELLAVLVDRRGGFVSAGEAISCLWEDEDSNKVTLARYRKVAMRLKRELEENNISDIVIRDKGKRCINMDLVQCDLYEYLSDKEKNSNLYNGVYMQNYSWGEYTLPELGNE